MEDDTRGRVIKRSVHYPIVDAPRLNPASTLAGPHGPSRLGHQRTFSPSLGDQRLPDALSSPFTRRWSSEPATHDRGPSWPRALSEGQQGASHHPNSGGTVGQSKCPQEKYLLLGSTGGRISPTNTQDQQQKQEDSRTVTRMPGTDKFLGRIRTSLGKADDSSPTTFPTATHLPRLQTIIEDSIPGTPTGVLPVGGSMEADCCARIVQDRNEAESALSQSVTHKALVILQSENMEFVNQFLIPLLSLLPAKLGFSLIGMLSLSKDNKEQHADDLAWWLEWLVSSMKAKDELFFYIYSEDEGGINVTAETLKVQLVDKVLKKNDITLHMLVDGIEGADLPWYLEVTKTVEKGLRGQWKCSDCRPTQKNLSMSTVMQICANRSYHPGIVTGAFIDVVSKACFISYIQLHHAMDVFIHVAEVESDPDVTSQVVCSLPTCYRSVDPATRSLVGGFLTRMGDSVVWRMKMGSRKRNLRKKRELMNKGFLLCSARFVDENMSLIFRKWVAPPDEAWPDIPKDRHPPAVLVRPAGELQSTEPGTPSRRAQGIPSPWGSPKHMAAGSSPCLGEEMNLLHPSAPTI